MKDEKLERISAMMDGELEGRDRDGAIKDIEIDPATKGSWQRYHMIGDTMRNTLPSSVKPDLASRLNEMLEQEPAILAPKRKKKFNPSNYIKPLAGLAIAASVTAVAVVSFQSGQETPGLEANAPLASTVIPESVRTVKFESVENTIEANQLNPYILNHNQFNSRMGVQGVSPQARLVGHGSNR
ncbi:MAG: sigma-E factor negative regulatory protein [Gammaproteobacteria bacterium]